MFREELPCRRWEGKFYRVSSTNSRDDLPCNREHLPCNALPQLRRGPANLQGATPCNLAVPRLLRTLHPKKSSPPLILSTNTRRFRRFWGDSPCRRRGAPSRPCGGGRSAPSRRRDERGTGGPARRKPRPGQPRGVRRPLSRTHRPHLGRKPDPTVFGAKIFSRQIRGTTYPVGSYPVDTYPVVVAGTHTTG